MGWVAQDKDHYDGSRATIAVVVVHALKRAQEHFNYLVLFSFHLPAADALSEM